VVGAGTVVDAIGRSQDVVKTRFQLLSGKGSAPSIVGTLRDIVATEGFGRLYRGIASPILVEAPKRAVKFASFGFFKSVVIGDSKATLWTTSLCGA
jgi:solute carrier family 25 (mitochondrial 2-oxodicarboxylate transporter), member 21